MREDWLRQAQRGEDKDRFSELSPNVPPATTETVTVTATEKSTTSLRS